MKFTLEINCDNAAFTDEPNPEYSRLMEVRRILGTAISQLSCHPDDAIMALLYDYNGNRVGSWQFTD